MRVNVYASELPKGATRVEKVVDGRTLVGIRLLTDEDDPESAITFWGDSIGELHGMLQNAIDMLYRTPPVPRGYGE